MPRPIPTRLSPLALLLACALTPACSEPAPAAHAPFDIIPPADGGVEETASASQALSEHQIDGWGLPAGYLSLTYDDGPGEGTLEIARFLATRVVPATFFVNGCHLEGAPPADSNGTGSCIRNESSYPHGFYAELIRLGHRVGNHTQDHAVVTGAPPNTLYQLTENQRTLDAFIEDQVRLFRPPGNGWSDATWELVKDDPYVGTLLGPIYHTVPGPASRPEHDYGCLEQVHMSSAECTDVMLRHVARDGSTHGVVQLHDRRPTSWETRKAVSLTKRLIPALQELGYTFVPLDAIPGVLGPRRFDEEALSVWTHEFGDDVGWDVARSHWGSLRFADLQGDGRLELCGRGNTGVRCVSTYHLGRRAGFTSARTYTAAFSDADGYLPDRYGATLMFGDLDADGDDDICARYRDGVYCVKSLWDSGVGFQQVPVRWTRDFSDGRGWSQERYWGSLRLVDVDGDDRADLCGRSNAGIVCARARRRGGFGPLEGWLDDDFGDDDDSRLRHLSYATTLMFGDIDGDDDADVCMRKPLGIYCAPNLGGRFGATRLWSGRRFSDRDDWRRRRSSWGSLQLVDVDGDGDADVCGRAVTGVVCAFSNGEEFRPYQHLTNVELSNQAGWGADRYGSTMQIGRLNRDAVADVCVRRRRGVWCTHGSSALAAH